MSHSRLGPIQVPTVGLLCLLLVLNLPELIRCGKVSYISPRLIKPLPSQRRGHTLHLKQDQVYLPQEKRSSGFRSIIDYGDNKPIRYRTLTNYDLPGQYQSRSKYPDRRGRLSHVIPLFRRKRLQFRNRVLPRFKWWVKKLGNVPMALAAVPFMTTVGIALLLKCHVNNCGIKKRKKDESGETEEEETMPQMRNDEQAAAEKLALAIGVTAVTAESINLMAYQIGLLNTLRSLPSVPMLASEVKKFIQLQNTTGDATSVATETKLEIDKDKISKNKTKLGLKV